MKTIGLLGGMSWQSTVSYYRLINEGVAEKLGGLHSAKIVMHSVDFHPVEQCLRGGDWDGVARILVPAAQSVRSAGADFLVLCTNTMHRVAAEIENSVDIPLLHIADATADALLQNGVKQAGLLGTASTMEQDFYKARLNSKHGIDVRVPGPGDRAIVDRVIFDELCLGRILPESKVEYLRIIRTLADEGAGAVILGCTEIGSLIHQADTPIRLFDTTAVHANKAVELATA